MSANDPPETPARSSAATPMPRVVAVIGLGLMGGSLCRVLKFGPNPPVVLGFDPSALEGARALESGAIDRYEPDPSESLWEADLVVYATPLSATLRLVAEHASFLGPEALLTDMVSLKEPIMEVVGAAGLGDRFVGAHPICGGEGSGFSAGSAALFQGAPVWLCAREEAPAEVRERIEGFWRSVGARPRWTDPKEHDQRMAWVSHLPQLVANALAGALESAGCHRDEMGPGGRDMTRLAGSNPEIWRDLLEASAPVTGMGLTSISNALSVLADLLAKRELDRIVEFMERTRRWSLGEP